MIYVIGPGHGGPGIVANTYLEGSYSEIYPVHRSGSTTACSGSSASSRWPCGIPSHVRAETSGLDPRGRRARLLARRMRYGAAFDNPDLIVACVVGDGEAETGPLATSLALATSF